MGDAPSIEWDDGYPTEESLEEARVFWGKHDADKFLLIDKWLRETLAYCANNCCAVCHEEHAKDIVDRDVIHIHFSTGGWSGAEDLIGLISGCFFLNMKMLQWQRGGHYIFEVKP